MLRSVIASTVLGAVVGSVLAAGVLFARADGRIAWARRWRAGAKQCD